MTFMNRDKTEGGKMSTKQNKAVYRSLLRMLSNIL